MRLAPLFLLCAGLASAAFKPTELVLLVHFDGYESLERERADAAILERALAAAAPFSRYSAAVRVQPLSSAPDRLCRAKKLGPKTVLECAPELLAIVNAAKIERFKLVVLSRDEFAPNAKVARGKNSAVYIPSAPAALTPAEREAWLQRSFLHELGHAFGLRDEFGRDRKASAVVDHEAAAAPSSNAAYRPARPNCAPDLETAREWWGDSVGVDGTGYYRGCAGQETAVRPSDGKLMSGHAQELSYGFVAESYLDSVLRCFYVKEDTKACRRFMKLYPRFWDE